MLFGVLLFFCRHCEMNFTIPQIILLPSYKMVLQQVAMLLYFLLEKETKHVT